jgi:hypothetical protein
MVIKAPQSSRTPNPRIRRSFTLERKPGRLGRGLPPVDLEKLPSFNQGFEVYGPPPCRVHEPPPHRAELLVPDII